MNKSRPSTSNRTVSQREPTVSATTRNSTNSQPRSSLTSARVPVAPSQNQSLSSRASLSNSKRLSNQLNQSTTTTWTPYSKTLHQSLLEKINSINSRIEAFEENTSQERRISAIESAFETFKLENSDLQQTVSILRSDLESVQFVLVQLCELETKVAESNNSVRRLTEENETLKITVAELKTETAILKSEVSDLSKRVELQNKASASNDFNITQGQLEINPNIIVRGLNLPVDSSEAQLSSVYTGLRNHLGISDISEFDPVRVQLLSTNNNKSSILQVCLQSSSAKKQFLQIRRTKKDIYPSDIGLTNQHRKPILVSEQLTRSNQELLFRARSLRGAGGYKFIWSSNGQILARKSQNCRVIRILNEQHVSQLNKLIESNSLLLGVNNGSRHTTNSIRNDECNTQS